MLQDPRNPRALLMTAATIAEFGLLTLARGQLPRPLHGFASGWPRAAGDVRGDDASQPALALEAPASHAVAETVEGPTRPWARAAPVADRVRTRVCVWSRR